MRVWGQLAGRALLTGVVFASPLAAERRNVVPGRSPGQAISIDPRSARRDSGDWPKYCANLALTGVAAGELRISRDSAPTLRPAWQDTLTGAVASSPIVVRGRVHVGDWSGAEWVVDAGDGHLLATENLGMTTAAQCTPPVLGITSAPAEQDGVIYLAGGDDGFYALDEATLARIWRTSIDPRNPPGGYYGWSSPAFFRGIVYQGISSNCDNPFIPGRLDALDPASGAILGSADFSPVGIPSHYGAGIWTSPAVDDRTGKIFVTTASAWHYEDGLSYSIARIASGTLLIEDSWKIPREDFDLTVDADWGSSPTLFADGEGGALVGAGQKNGYYYAFRRDALSSGPLWKTAIAVPGLCPQCSEGSISTAAFDGSRLYVGGGYPANFAPPSPGAVTALDPATGAVVWRATMPGPVLAPISVANGVVFAAGGKRCVALRSDTGEVLWQADTESDVYGGIAISRGRIFFGDLAGNLYAYEIPAGP